MNRLFILLFLTGLCLSISSTASYAKLKPQTIRSIDRDRILLDSGEWIRLIGIDMRDLASSKKPAVLFSDEVNRFLKSFVDKEVYLEFDPSAKSNSREKTAYVYYLTRTPAVRFQGSGFGAKPVMIVDKLKKEDGRLRAGVTPHMEIMLNIELIKRGYARADEKQSFRHKKQFLLAQREAELDHVGVWE